MTTKNLNVKIITRPQSPQISDEERIELEQLERQLIPVINSIRKRLGKRPVVVPKEPITLY